MTERRLALIRVAERESETVSNSLALLSPESPLSLVVGISADKAYLFAWITRGWIGVEEDRDCIRRNSAETIQTVP